MASSKKSTTKKAKQDPEQEKRENARIRLFFQLLDVKRDTNMTRYYSAIQYKNR